MLKIYKAKWILPANGQIIKNGAVLVQNSKIIDIITENNFENFSQSGEIIDYKNAVITPGFINLHAHLQFTDLKKDLQKQNPVNFSDWIINLMEQYTKLTESQKILSVENGIKEALLSGTTCVAQISKEEDFIEIFKNSKIRTYFFIETFSNNEENSIIEFNKLKEKIKFMEQNSHELINIGISPHSIYNVHNILWKKIAEFSKENDILVQTHFAESEAEINWLNNKCSDIDLIHKFVGWDKTSPFKKGLNPVQYLEELDILKNINKNLILTHLNQLQEEDFKKLAQYDIKIVHCPRSNVLLHGKTVDIAKLLNLNNLSNRIGIGTDSKFSNYDLNIINEAKFIKNKTGLDSLKLLDMLTINAAKILRLNHKIGSLEKGKEADFLMFKLNKGENYLNFIEKNSPDDVYIQGKKTVHNKKLI